MDVFRRGVLVAGGAGFVGSHLVDSLVAAGVHVHVIDDLSSGKVANIATHAGKPGFTFYKADLRDRQAVASALARMDPAPSAVFHLAASAHEGLLQGSKDDDVLATLNLLEALSKRGDEAGQGMRVMFASSGQVYRCAADEIFADNNGLAQQANHHAASKLACEAAVRAFCSKFGWTGLIFRLSNVVARGRGGGCCRTC